MLLPEQTDSWLLGLSCQLGEDLTPHQDLEQRLDAAVLSARVCQQDLVDFSNRIRDYELTIEGHIPTPAFQLVAIEPAEEN